MYVLDVAAPAGRDPSPVVDRLLARFEESGQVAVVRRDTVLDAPDHTTVRVGDGGWRSTSGTDIDLDAALDTLAATHAYAITIGFPDAALPRLAIGDVDVEDPLARVSGADDVDVDAVADALHETEPHESLSSLVAAAKRSPDAEFSGAIATFTGRVRAKEDPEDARTEALEFEKYDGVAEERFEEITSDIEARDGVYEVLLHHRTGRIETGEDIVFVVVLAGHRREAFRAVEDGIDRLKDEVPLFKKEVTVDDTFWSHERDA
ncbi:molybdopterin synthase [Halarchaeum sp. P4]|uniref:molybdopterin synthase n=1 Tax=Halarchaeum sp. P4 TaxID=3421639 RepID=UPI003EBEF68E